MGDIKQFGEGRENPTMELLFLENLILCDAFLGLHPSNSVSMMPKLF